MLEAEKITLVKSLSGETDDSTVSAYLALAGNKICRRAYPFSPSVMKVPEQYEHAQIEIAVYMLSRRGTVGVISHTENGYSDTYESGDVPTSLLRGIIPMCGTFGGDGNGQDS